MKIQLDEGAMPPYKKRLEDAGYDLASNETVTIKAHKSVVIDTGVHMAIPDGYYGDIRSRSGLNIKHQVFVPNGTVDCGYTGSIKVRLYNFSDEDYDINQGDRIAQIVLTPYANRDMVRVPKLDDTDRGGKGFGSSGR